MVVVVVVMVIVIMMMMGLLLYFVFGGWLEGMQLRLLIMGRGWFLIGGVRLTLTGYFGASFSSFSSSSSPYFF